jgi:GNAT superfamily N-acetyltransferase
VTDDPTPASLRARVDEELAAGWHVTVAELEGEVVGFLALRPNLAKLDQIFVAPDWHGKGVGRALFAAAQRELRGGFTLSTHAANARARRLYEALGPERAEPGAHPRYGHLVITYWFGAA